MAEVFINYRTGDGEWPAAFLDDKFKSRYGTDRVFRDATSLEPGRDFRPNLLRRLERCTILLVIIGPTWLTARDESGLRRLDNVEDYVRMEIEESLKRKIRILPITLNEVRLPLPDELPKKITNLSHYQSRAFRSRHYQTDFEEIVNIVDKEVPLATQDKDAEIISTAGSNGNRTVRRAKRSAVSMGDGPANYHERGHA